MAVAVAEETEGTSWIISSPDSVRDDDIDNGKK